MTIKTSAKTTKSKPLQRNGRFWYNILVGNNIETASFSLHKAFVNQVSNMNVLIISHMYPSNFNSMSGIFVYQQARALTENGCIVKVISPVPWAPFPLNKMSEKWKGYSDIPFKDLTGSIKAYYPRYLQLPGGILFDRTGYFMYKGLEKTVNEISRNFKFDIIHSNVALPDGYSGMLLSRRFNVPNVVTVHGQDFQVTIKRNEGCKRAVFKVLSSADGVITVSSKLKNMVREEKFFSNIDVINNGIDDDCLKHNAEDRQKGAIKILSVSNLKETKGIQLNLKAVYMLKDKYPNIQYDIIGGGEYEEKLRDLAKELNIEDRVNFLGRKSHEEVIRSMAGCDIFSLPSYSEGFGMVYIEAMSQGVPVIGVAGEGIEDAIRDGYNGFLVKREDEKSLARVLDTLIGDEVMRTKAGLSGRETVLKNFTWDRNAKKVISLYEKILQQSKSSR